MRSHFRNKPFGRGDSGCRKRVRTMNGSWKYRPPMLSPRFAHEVAIVGDDLFVLGGTDGNVGYGSVETRKVHGDGTWHYVGPMPTPRGNHAVGVVDGLLHAAAGITADERTTDGV